MSEMKKKTGIIRNAPSNHESFDWSIFPKDPNDRCIGQLVTCEESEAASCAAILFGLPFDGAVLGRRGAAGGPHALRAATRKLKTYHLEHGELGTKILELGDAQLPINNVSNAHQGAESKARQALALSQKSPDHPALCIALGGDHSLTFPCAWPWLEAYGDRLAVINLDAHLDIRTVEEGKPQNSGTSFARLLEKGLKSYTVIGARDFQNAPHYVRKSLETHGHIKSARQVHTQGVPAIVEDVISNLPKNCEAIYLSLDIDVGDASIAPAVSAPTPGGLTAHQVFDLIQHLVSDPRVIACDIMELAPMLAVPGSDRTPQFAAGCLAEMLSAVQRRNR